MRIIEAYMGEYASGKSENATNRALDLASRGRNVTLVDLDLIKSTSNKELFVEIMKDQNVDVLFIEPEDNLEPADSNDVTVSDVYKVLSRDGDIIFDLSYGIGGAKLLNQIEGAKDNPDIRRILVANFARPLLAEAGDLVEYANDLGHIDALVVNTHQGEYTALEMVIEGVRKAVIAAYELSVPIDAVIVSDDFIKNFPNFALSNDYVEVDREKYPLRILRCFL